MKGDKYMYKQDVIDAINDLTEKIQAEGIPDAEYSNYLQLLYTLENAAIILKQ